MAWDQNDYHRRRRAEKRERGECRDCTRPAVPGMVYCEHHRERNRQYLQRRNQTRAERKADKAHPFRPTPEVIAQRKREFHRRLERCPELVIERLADLIYGNPGQGA